MFNKEMVMTSPITVPFMLTINAHFFLLNMLETISENLTLSTKSGYRWLILYSDNF